ncbi:MAG: DsbA family protein [Rhodothalassiaceae bacterium]
MRRILTGFLGLTLLVGLLWTTGLPRWGGPAQAQEQAQSEQSTSPFTPEQEARIAELVEQTLLEKPEILVQASQLLRIRQQLEEQRRLQQQAMAQRSAIEDDPMAPVAGNPDGEITVVEFYDYQCPFCRRAYDDVKQLLQRQTTVRYQFRQFPVLDREGEPPVSRTAARYALAADQQGKFLAYHDAVMTSGGRLTLDRLDELALQAGLDLAQLKAYAADPAIERYLDETLDLAREVGIDGTPTFIINGRALPGAQGLEAIEATIAEAKADMQTGE